MSSTALTSPPLWLDLLPREVCTHIASHLSRGTPSPSLLNLSELSSIQALAALSALSHSLNLHFSSKPSFAQELNRWAQVAAPTLVELCIDGHSSEYMTAQALKSAAHLLANAPSLRKVALPNEPELVAPLSLLTDLQELSIPVIYGDKMDAWLSALDHLQTPLSITKLDLGFPTEYKQCHPATFWTTFSCILKTACPSLTDFEFHCMCYRDGFRKTCTEHVLNNFPRLQATCIWRGVLLSAFDHVRQLHSVRLMDYGDAHAHAVSLGSAVTEVFGFNTVELDAGQLASFRHYTRMEKLQIIIQSGAESALLDVVRQMPALRVLDVDTVAGNEGDRTIDRWPRLHGPRKGIYLAVVQAAPMLTEVHLRDVRMAKEEVFEIMRHVGSRLQMFAISVCEHEENPWDMLEYLLHAAVKYNPNLRRFDLMGDMPFEAEYFKRLDVYERRGSQGSTLVTAVKRLEQAAPFFDSAKLKEIAAIWYFGGR